MAKFKFTNSAVKDLSEIWSYTIDTWSESQADTCHKDFELTQQTFDLRINSYLGCSPLI